MSFTICHKQMVLASSLLMACTNLILSVGCGNSATDQGRTIGNTTQGVLQLTPATATLSQGEGVKFALLSDGVPVSPSHCIWVAGDNAILSSKGDGEFVGTGFGSSSVTAVCDENSTSASALVTASTNPTAIRITSGGTYSGNWSSMDPKVPAVMIITNEPVILQNSTVSGRGDLIVVYGGSGGADVTVDNVTGTALEPGVAGLSRGKFLDAEVMSHVSVTHCTMHGVSFGIYVVSSMLASVNIRDNVADNLEDRKSDGNGGFLLNQRVLGHFIMFNGDAMPNGGEVAWNQMTNSDGVASVEDLISFYQSHGSQEGPVLVHDNYLQGAFATGQTTGYTGAGMQMDGASNDPLTATGFVQIKNNTIVHLAGSGISIAAGHDISVIGNRIVSCGKDSSGNWIAMPGSNALVMWNYYQTSQYFNNYMANNSGGLVRPDADGNPSVGEVGAPSVSSSLNNVIGANSFEQPCLASSNPDLTAESLEKARWFNTVAQSGELLGDQH